MIERYINTAVKEAPYPIKTIAENSYISEKTLYKIRNGEQTPSADKTLSIAKALNRPELIRHHCSSCPIGSIFHLIYLNGRIRGEGHEILQKSHIEIKEWVDLFSKGIEMMFKNFTPDDYSEEDKALAKKLLDEGIDVRHCIETYETWYAKTFGIQELEKEIKDHNEKCYDRGFALR